MNTLKKMDCWSTGLAIFAMFFGAGNIIFPLALGQYALDKTPWGLAGLLLTAIILPFAGLLAMIRYRGEIRSFFGRLGRIPGFGLACLIIALLGPFGAAPRCITLAHSTLSLAMPGIPLIGFSAMACILLFCFSYRENRLLKWLGYLLSPLKISLLTLIIVKGFLEAPPLTGISAHGSELSHFWHGLTEGYNTMDLLAAFFFAPILLISRKTTDEPELSRFMFKASCIGASLLALIYTGFCYLAYLYVPHLQGVSSDQLLAAIAIHILGSHAGVLVSLTVTVACLTTAVALIAAFTRFVYKEILTQRASYLWILTLSLLLTFAITSLGFQGIARFLSPMLEICYPILIVLTLYNLLHPAPVIICQRQEVPLPIGNGATRDCSRQDSRNRSRDVSTISVETMSQPEERNLVKPDGHSESEIKNEHV